MIFGYRVILQPYFFQTDKGISAGVNIFSSSFKIGPKARQSIYIDAICNENMPNVTEIRDFGKQKRKSADLAKSIKINTRKHVVFGFSNQSQIYYDICGNSHIFQNKRDDGFKIHRYIYTVSGRSCVYLEFVLLWEINERGGGKSQTPELRDTVM